MKKSARSPLRSAFYSTELEGIGPRLNFIRRDEMNDARPNYTAQFLQHLAEGLRRTPAGNLPPGCPPSPDFGAVLAATVLEELASNEGALEAMNRAQSTVNGEFLGVNRAVHYHALIEREPGVKRLALQTDVANAWGVTTAQVKDDYTKHRATVQKLVEGIVGEAMGVHYPTLADARNALVADMEYRAEQTRTKRRRIKNRKLSA